MTATPVVLLDECKPLFSDESNYQEFVQWMEKKLGHDFSPVIAGKDVLGSVLSPKATKEFIYDRMIEQIAESPEFVDDIKNRLENEEIVD